VFVCPYKHLACFVWTNRVQIYPGVHSCTLPRPLLEGQAGILIITSLVTVTEFQLLLLTTSPLFPLVFNVLTVNKDKYTWPTLFTELYHSFIWYAGSYMFRGTCAIFRDLLMSTWVTWKQKRLGCWSCTVMVGSLCALIVAHGCRNM
jgi:hypothetical protein